MSSAPCELCHGARLKRGHLAVQVKGVAIGEFTSLGLARALALVKTWTLNERESAIAVRIVEEIRDRLEFLCNVGLDT
jgi:excinuclease ABC subunit A